VTGDIDAHAVEELDRAADLTAGLALPTAVTR
jgi:hypothetical protein